MSSILFDCVLEFQSFDSVVFDYRMFARYHGSYVAHFYSVLSFQLTAVKREKFAKNKKNTSKERLSFLLFKV